jgi:isochorismate pyruvate lyase
VFLRDAGHRCQNMSMDQPKLPQECSSLAEVRAEIDRIDRNIIGAIGRRRHYVMAAAKFKSSAAAVAAPERFAAMLQTRRQWAEQEGLNPDVVEKLYRELVNYFIVEELAYWTESSRSSS